MKKTNQKESVKLGRKSLLTEETVAKLESILKIGGTVEEACSYALINKTTYYRWLEEDEAFATKMDSAQHYSDIVAKNVVVDSMIKDKDIQTSKWWLEKRQYNTTKQEIDMKTDGEKIGGFILIKKDDKNNLPGSTPNK